MRCTGGGLLAWVVERLAADIERLRAEHEALERSMDKKFSLNTSDAIGSGMMAVAGAVLLLIADW
jgi:hypothetical protein